MSYPAGSIAAMRNAPESLRYHVRFSLGPVIPDLKYPRGY